VLKLTDRNETHPVIRWLMTDARKRTDACEFLEAFALELRAAGMDVARITTGVPILHPQSFSSSGLWQLDKGTTERLYRAGPDSLAIMARSPIRIAYEGRGPVRCDLIAPAQDGEFPILEDPRRDLALRPAGLHQSFRDTAARRVDRPSQLLFRPRCATRSRRRAARS
jgi:adenylate cyclase